MAFLVAIVGGGAAGFFAAIWAKQNHPNAQVLLLEKTRVLLSKVRISGGGRCNVTHSCFDPKELCTNYPRGGKELLGPFSHFQPRDTIDWFQKRGVTLKTEKDGRIFPITDNSETIIQCLMGEAKKLGVEIWLGQKIETIHKTEGEFQITLQENISLQCSKLLLATGSSPKGYEWAQKFGHTIQSPVPSLFTFNVPTSPLKELTGVSVQDAQLYIDSFTQRGPLLLTHFGFSGPAAIKLSAWAARFLHAKNYQVDLFVNWVPKYSRQQLFDHLLRLKEDSPKDTLLGLNPFSLPKSLWKHLLQSNASIALHAISKKALHQLGEKLHKDRYAVEGKTTHKEEFVTCGGVTLKEVDFQTMQSKICEGLYFAGEILDIDGVTGGFNFQNAWTTGYLAGSHI